MTHAPLRIDKWLWYARQFKTRTLAAKIVNAGKIRVNNQRITKASQTVQIGDTLTFVAHEKLRILKISELGSRRGPASEAVQLYEDLTPVEEHAKGKDNAKPNAGVRDEGAGRPTKKQRREIDALMDRSA